jgi:hypothetical protein
MANVRRWISLAGGRWLALPPALLSIVWILAAGCGGRPLALTGGSIPIGAAQLQGKVVRADDIGRPIAGAAVVLARGQASGIRYTDAEGDFSFDNIAGGSYACTIFPPEGSGLQAWTNQLQFPEGERAQLIATMLPTNVNPGSVAQVKIVPNGYSLSVGESVRFTAHALDQANAELNLRGSLLLIGDVGELTQDGTFQATNPGTGSLTGWVGSAVTTAEVKVNPGPQPGQ